MWEFLNYLVDSAKAALGIENNSSIDKKRKFEENTSMDDEVLRPGKRPKLNLSEIDLTKDLETPIEVEFSGIEQEINSLNNALAYLEQLDRSKKVDLDLGDVSLEVILSPLMRPTYDGYGSNNAWLSNFFIENFIKEKIVQSGQKDINLFLLNPDFPDLTNRFKRFAQRNTRNNKIIWPICHSHHFYLITIAYDKEKNQVYIGYVDGFNDEQTQNKFLGKASELASLLYPDADVQIQVKEKIADQNNAIDCGVVVCYFANHFIKKTVSEFQTWLQTSPIPNAAVLDTLGPYTPYRKKVAEVIHDAAHKRLLDSGHPELVSQKWQPLS